MGNSFLNIEIRKLMVEVLVFQLFVIQGCIIHWYDYNSIQVPTIVRTRWWTLGTRSLPDRVCLRLIVMKTSTGEGV